MDRVDGWDDRALLLLGVLMTQSRHGYQINDFIERSLCHVATMKKPTAYALLDRLASAGFVSVRAEQAGNRPQRKVYSITPAGQDLFRRLLRENLSSIDETTFDGDIGVMLLDQLGRDEALDLLRRRLASLDAVLAHQTPPPPHDDALRIDLALDHLLAMRRADRDWLAATITRLERERPPSHPDASPIRD